MGQSGTDVATKRDRIVQELRRRILSGQYERGARLRQDELATDLQVSITPVREALRILESENLVQSEPHKGVRVAGVDLDRVNAIYVTRRLLESFATRRAALRMSRKHLAAQRDLLTVMSDPGLHEHQLRSANHEFHFGFYRRCELPELTNQIERLWGSFPWDLRIRDASQVDVSYADHARILAAVEAGDADAAARHMEQHLATSYANMRRTLTGEAGVDPFDEDGRSS